jgi:hypothetical protein
MLQRFRWWLVRKLIGRSSVLANCHIEHDEKDVEICVGEGLFYGNNIVGDWPTLVDNGRVRMMTRPLALKHSS